MPMNALMIMSTIYSLEKQNSTFIIDGAEYTTKFG